MKANWLPLSAAVALALGSVTASAVDFHGYFRAGIQASAQGGDVYCAGDGTAGHKVGRLGDECDTYAEIALSQEVYNKANSKFTVNTRLAYGTTQAGDGHDTQWNDWQAAGNSGDEKADGWNGGRLAMREFFADYQTTDGYKIWAGKRFYQRKDIHIWDIYTLSTAGYGAGIEAIDLGTGLGNLNFAVMKATDTNSGGTNRSVYKIDARWNGIGLGDFGTIDFAVIYGLPWVSDAQKDLEFNKNSGVLLTLDHSYAGNGLMNHFIVQYGTNGFSDIGAFGSNGAGGVYTSGKDLQGVRVVDWGTYDIGNFGLGYGLFWGHINYGDNASGSWSRHDSGWEYALTVRPEYKWTEYTRTTMELGYSKQKEAAWNTDADDADLYKVTLAQQFTPGKGFWSRPAIRFYVSYLGGDQFVSKVGRANLDGSNHQWSFGSQVEAWW